MFFLLIGRSCFRYNTGMEELLRRSLLIDPPLMNAAGSLGFAPDLKLPLPWDKFGAFVTNPISSRPRKPASGTRWVDVPAGALLHSGYPNPGFRQSVDLYADAWAQSPLPVIVHLLAETPAEIARRIIQLETLENIQAVEIGFPEQVSAVEAAEVIAAAFGELPVLARLSLGAAVGLAEACYQAGAAAISLGPPRGAAMGNQGFVSGRMIGPAAFPLALQAVRQFAGMQIPVIAAGGVYTQQQADAVRQAGALAVQLDLALWRGDWFTSGED